MRIDRQTFIFPIIIRFIVDAAESPSFSLSAESHVVHKARKHTTVDTTHSLMIDYFAERCVTTQQPGRRSMEATMQMRKTYKYKLLPTPGQERALETTFFIARCWADPRR